MDRFEKFERKIIEGIFSTTEKDPSYIRYENSQFSKSELVAKIKQQYENSAIVNRQFTGAGFYTYFQVNDKSLLLGDDVNFGLGGIHAKIKGLERGAGFTLEIENGALNNLEGYTYAEGTWPKKITDYQLYLVNKDGTTTKIID